MAARRLALSDEPSIGEELAGWGKVCLLETYGRSTGRPARVAVGFVEDADGSLLVAAGAPESDWALNLMADARCSATIGDRTTRCTARLVDGAPRAEALTALILKYGTPAERLGRGPVFRLSAVDQERHGTGDHRAD